MLEANGGFEPLGRASSPAGKAARVRGGGGLVDEARLVNGKRRRRSLYEINTRVWLRDLSEAEGRAISLGDVPEVEIERLVDLGIELVWLMGVWRVSRAGIEIARTHPGLLEEYRRALPDWTPDDVVGSPYAVAEYTVDPSTGGTRGLTVFRDRLARRGIGLILDFVPNHTARDHAWVSSKPDLYVNGRPEDLAREPGNWYEADTRLGRRIIAHGRDPNFPGWTDTAQIDFRNPAAHEALGNVLRAICGLCDGVRCDMAMLPLNEVFARTWGPRKDPSGAPLPARADFPEFWPGAIAGVRAVHPGFIFMAEAYWGLEGRLRELGFEYTYDKGLYDALVWGDAGRVAGHLAALGPDQDCHVRFLENHDEPRAAAALPWEREQAAAILVATLPGLPLYHEGQLDGRRIRVPVQLRRRAVEPVDARVRSFYETLLRAAARPALREGRWRPLRTREAWPGSPTWRSILAHAWDAGHAGRAIVAVNFCGDQGHAFIDMAPFSLPEGTVELRDLVSGALYLRDAVELAEKGLYVDLPPYGALVLDAAGHRGGT